MTTLTTLPADTADLDFEDSFDALEELLEEELSDHSQPVSTLPDDDSFDDLEALIVESKNIAAAKTARKLGRKLSAAQNDLLTAQQLVEQMTLWEPTTAIAHFTHTTCTTCGYSSPDLEFVAWYELLQHKHQPTTRQLRVTTTPDSILPTSRYVTVKQVPICNCCVQLPQFPPVSLSSLPLLSVLGIPEESCL